MCLLKSNYNKTIIIMSQVENSEDKTHHKRERRRHSHKDSNKKRSTRRSKSRSAMKGFGATLLKNFLAILYYLIDALLEYCLGFYWGPKKICPSVSTKNGENDIVTKSAVDLAKLVRERKLKSYDVVKAYINRINEINGLLNAVADGPFMEALDEAKQIDERIENGKVSEKEFEEKPFLGIPFTTKESTTVKGKSHTLGLISRKGVVAKEDAECVKLIKQAGGIIIATSNIPEVNKWIETRSTMYGQTNNPYDVRRSAGGSSGGEGVLVSACGTAFGLGTDIGGSVRIPAFNCGIFGHKPSPGAVNTKGCTFRTGNEKSTMVVVGPMARYTGDLRKIFEVLVGPTKIVELKLNEKVDLTKLKYYYIPTNNMMHCNPITKESQRVMFKITEHFSELTGEKVTLATLPGLKYSGNLWRYWMTQEPANFNMLLGNGVELNPFIEIGKKIFGRGDFTIAAIYSLFDGLLPSEKAEFMQELTQQCDEALANLLGDDGVLFFHSSPRTAPFHYYPLVRFNDFNYFAIFNVLKVPATQVPMGIDSNGLPKGIQVVAGRNRDHHCLAVAEELERTFGGWVPPFKPSE